MARAVTWSSQRRPSRRPIPVEDLWLVDVGAGGIEPEIEEPAAVSDEMEEELSSSKMTRWLSW